MHCCHRVSRRLAPVVLIAAALILLQLPAIAVAADVKPSSLKNPDITVTWDGKDYMEGYDTLPGRFYIDGRFVGKNEAGMKAVVETVRQLPRGASVVWWRDVKKIVDREPGSETVPPAVYPKLWKESQQLAKERGITLSSLGYRPRYDDEPRRLDVTCIAPTEPVLRGDVTLQWKSNGAFDWPTYYLNGSESGRGPNGLRNTAERLAQSLVGARLRVSSRDPGALVVHDFPRELRDAAVTRRMPVVFEVKQEHWPKFANSPAHCQFEWRNFRSAATPHKEVVYLVDGKAVGMGDAGFDAVLKRLKQLPPGSYVEYPQYGVHGKAYQGKAQREKVNSNIPVPFVHRRNELETVLQNGKFVIGRSYVLYWPNPTYGDYVDSDTERQWYLTKLLSFTTIIRDDTKPAPSEAIISWTQQPRRPDQRKQPPAEAVYFYNGQKTGLGTQGFLAVLKRLESLPEGATVRIDPVSIRTHGPFRYAIVMRGQRHFEATGTDPFQGLVDLLADVVDRKRLRVELIPAKQSPYPHQR